MSYAAVTNPNASELVFFDQKNNFQQYVISVQSVNDMGEAPTQREEKKIGYSGEGSELIIPFIFGYRPLSKRSEIAKKISGRG